MKFLLFLFLPALGYGQSANPFGGTSFPGPYATFSDQGSNTPAPALGRLFFSSTNQGALFISLDGVSFVPISTGTAIDTFSSVRADANEFNGDGNNTVLSLKSSSVTMQGNTFNGAGQLIQTTGASKYPALDGSLITGVILNGGAQAVASIAVGAGLSFSSAPVGHVSGSTLVGTLASGTTFLTFVPDSPITLKRVNADVIAPGLGGSGDTINCHAANVSGITVTLSAAASIGTDATAVGNTNISYQTKVYCEMDSAATTRPIVNMTLEYINQ